MTLAMADDYLGDPKKLLNFAICWQCADIKSKLGRAEKTILKLCNRVAHSPAAKRAATMEAAREAMQDATRVFARAYMRLHGSSVEVWDEALGDYLLKRPGRCQKVLADYRRVALAEFKRPHDPAPAALPYAD